MLQRVDFDGLIFRDVHGNQLNADAHLEIAAWPDRVSFLVEIVPRETFAAASLQLQLQVRGMTTEANLSDAVSGTWPAGETRRAWVAASVPTKNERRPRSSSGFLPRPGSLP